MEVRFWGVRGSVAVSGPEYLRAGGNTSCVEVRSGDERLILDGGTGLHALGQRHGPGPLRATLLFTHVHWDHIQGMPFFGPAFHPDSHLTLVGAHRPSGSLQDALRRQMRPPAFPVTLDSFNAQLHFIDIKRPHTFQHGRFAITPMDLEHPDGVIAYRIEADGRSVVYATDVEHGSTLDRRLLDLAQGADLLIHDAQYTDAEYRGVTGPSRRGWGHSTWGQATAVAQAAGVRRLALFHHDPLRHDTAVRDIERAADTRFRGTFAAREGLSVTL